MSMYLLDTNICIFVQNRRPPHVLEKLKRVSARSRVFISGITVAELQYGVYHSQRVEQNRIALAGFLSPFDILPFDDVDAEQYGILRAQLKKAGQIIGPYDMLIAAQAIARKLTLVTNNLAEFERVKGLKVEDWR